MREKSLLLILVLLAAMSLSLLSGCSTMEEPNEDQYEKWRILAEQSQGHSPSSRTEVQEIEDLVIKSEVIEEEAPKVEHHLPEFKLTLRMHDADLIAVLQALSRAAKQSIVVSPAVEGVVNINIVETPWSQVFRGILAANRLTYTWEGDIIRVMTTEDVQADLDLDVLRKKEQAVMWELKKVEPRVTSILKVRFADAQELVETMLPFMTTDGEGKPVGSIQVDTNTNSLIIQGMRTDVEKIIRIVTSLDSPRAQIKLKAHIVETTQETARALGVQWGGSLFSKLVSGDSTDRLMVLPGGSGSYSVNEDTGQGTLTIEGDQGTGSAGQANSIGFPIQDLTEYGYGAGMSFAYGTLGQSLLEVQLQMLEDANKLRIISSPSITTMDNQKAFTESGERVPYQTTETSGGTVTAKVEFEEVVLRLEITPHIIDDQFLKLEVVVKKDEVDLSRSVDGNPYIIKKQTETTLIARNGETVVISGLTKHRSSYSDAGVPYLKDVPGVKRLFSTETKSDLLDEFLIFITPTVLQEWRPGEKQMSLEDIERELEAKREMQSKAEEEQEGSK